MIQFPEKNQELLDILFIFIIKYVNNYNLNVPHLQSERQKLPT